MIAVEKKLNCEQEELWDSRAFVLSLFIIYCYLFYIIINVGWLLSDYSRTIVLIIQP